MGLAEDPQPALDQGRVGQHPPVQGAVINLKAALEEQLLDVAIAQRIAQVPRDRLQDQRCLEVPALEIVLRPALQLLDKAVQDHGPPPTTEVLMPPACSTRGKRQNFATAPSIMPAPSLGWATPKGADQSAMTVSIRKPAASAF